MILVRKTTSGWANPPHQSCLNGPPQHIMTQKILDSDFLRWTRQNGALLRLGWQHTWRWMGLHIELASSMKSIICDYEYSPTDYVNIHNGKCTLFLLFVADQEEQPSAQLVPDGWPHHHLWPIKINKIITTQWLTVSIALIRSHSLGPTPRSPSPCSWKLGCLERSSCFREKLKTGKATPSLEGT